MLRAAAIGERARVAGYALAGVEVHLADSPEEVLAAWAALDRDVVLVVLTPAAAAALPEAEEDGERRLRAVLP